MNTQDSMVRELTTHKSLDALVFLLHQGREVAFHVDEVSCFMSRRRGVVCLWCGNEERQFASAEELTKDQAFLNLWKKAFVDTVY